MLIYCSVNCALGQDICCYFAKKYLVRWVLMSTHLKIPPLRGRTFAVILQIFHLKYG